MNHENVSIKYFSLKPGLYLLTYVSATNHRARPEAVISKRPQFGSGTVAFLYSNEKADGQLSAPGDCVVIRVAQNIVQLQVAIYDIENSHPDIEFKLDSLTERLPEQKLTASTAKKVAGTKNIKTLKELKKEINQAEKLAKEKTLEIIPLALSGHIERQGDIYKKAGKWLGKRDDNKRIESFAVQWTSPPKGVQLEYHCEVQGLGWLPMVSCGQWVGTKYRALPITALSFKISGKRKNNFRILLQACFSESGVQQKQGETVLIEGLHTTEYLIALKVDIIKQSKSLEEGKKNGKKGIKEKYKKKKKGKNNKKIPEQNKTELIQGGRQKSKEKKSRSREQDEILVFKA